MPDDGHRDRLDTVGRRVQAGVTTELPGDTEVDGPMGIFAWVRGPQKRKRLPNGTEGVLHRTRSDWIIAGGNCAAAVALTVDL